MATQTKTRKPARKSSAKSVQSKFIAMRRDMNDTLIERGGEIDVLLTAVICQENPVFVGDPGTGKSFLLDTFLRWLSEDSSKWSGLFNKHTQPEEVFGPIDVRGLKDGVYKRVTAGKLPTVTVGFGDEIFKASTAILNTMLRILNEREYDDGTGTLVKCPLRVFVAASNEWPSDQEGGAELGALFDRFLFRKTVRPISRAGRSELLWNRDHTPTLSTSITIAELEQAHAEADAMPISKKAVAVFEQILDALNAEGIFPGDRRMFKAVHAVQGYAYLCGASEVEPEHLEILQHVLWNDPSEQPGKCASIVMRLANPTAHKVNELMVQAGSVVERDAPNEAVPKLQRVLAELQELDSSNIRVRGAIQFVQDEIAKAYNRVIGA